MRLVCPHPAKPRLSDQLQLSGDRNNHANQCRREHHINGKQGDEGNQHARPLSLHGKWSVVTEAEGFRRQEAERSADGCAKEWRKMNGVAARRTDVWRALDAIAEGYAIRVAVMSPVSKLMTKEPPWSSMAAPIASNKRSLTAESRATWSLRD